jgi:cobalt-zinc-cadmium efflux system protein
MSGAGDTPQEHDGRRDGHHPGHRHGHGPGHHHGHGPGHHHGHAVTATGRHRGVLAGALAATGGIFVVEVVGAYLSGSLALLADAGHVLADAGGVALALGAAVLAARPATNRRTFGWARAEVLAAAINGLVLAGIGVFVVVEGIRRLIEPSALRPGQMAVFAAIGLVGNLVAFGLLFRSRHASLNLRGAFLEVATDTAASVGVLVAAGIVAVTGFVRADPLLSLAIGLVILPRALRLLRDAGHVLLEATPENLDLEDVRRHIRELEHVRDVHELHAYTVTSGLPVLTAHVVIDDECFRDGHAPQMLDAVQRCLAGHFDVEHSTIQLEPAGHTDHERPAHA